MDILVDGELVLFGTVGEDLFGDGFTARDVVNALAKLKGKPVNVRINSGGGFADEGVAIYNTLKGHGGRVTVSVEGIAASAASLIAMAGNDIIMKTGSTMMIHDPLVLAVGNAETLEKSLEMLNVMANSMAEIYAAKTRRSASAIRAEMREEIWLGADAAIAKGYADRKDGKAAIEASAFDYRAYAHAPERMVALADAKGWSGKIKAVTPKLVAPRAPSWDKAIATAGNYLEVPISRNEAGAAAEAGEVWRESVAKFNSKFDKLMGGSNGN